MLTDFSRIPKSPTRVWLFQAVPERYDLEEALWTMDGDNWAVNQFKDDIEDGHLVVLWQSGENAGIYGIAETTSDKYPSPDPDESGKLRINLRHIYILPAPILRRDLKQHPVLSELVNTIHQGTNFKVSDSQWSAIYDLMKQKTITPSWWWVNQGRNWKEEQEGGYVFSVPVDHREVKHRTNVKLLKPGDHLIHYANKKIYATSMVTSEYQSVKRYGQDGWSVDVQYSPLKTPIAFEELPQSLCKDEKVRTLGSVFDKNGGVNQGYLFPLSNDFVSKLSELAGDKWTDTTKQDNTAEPRTKSVTNRAQLSGKAWSILVNTAKEQKTITYGDLADRLNVHHRAVRFNLGDIQEYCREEKLPPLTILVVNKHSHTPGAGFSAWDSDNLEPGFDKVYGYNWSQVENPFAYADDGSTEDDILEELYQSPQSAADVYRRVKARGRAQDLFKKLMRKVYDNRCAFCGLSFLPALEAAHIIPWSVATIEQRLDASNGLLLCSTHHKLFDASIMTLDSSYKIVFCGSAAMHSANEMDQRIGLSLHGTLASMPHSARHRPNKETLIQRNKELAVTEPA